MVFLRAAHVPVPLLAFALTAAIAPRAHAHDDAVFGPQSTLITSAPGFVTLQAFSRQLGNAAHVRESTVVASSAVSPFTDVPLSFVLTLPATVQTGARPLRSGVENVIAGARYRFEIPALRDAMHTDDDFFLIMVALEPPTGNAGYAPLKGPFSTHFTLLASAEWRPLSFNAFFYYRYIGIDSVETKRGNIAVSGLSAAYTPFSSLGRSLGIQAAILEESHFHNFVGGVPQSNSGGSEILLSPALVWTAHPRWQFFAQVAFPVSQGLNADAERDRFRAGLGIVHFMGPLRVDAKNGEGDGAGTQPAMPPPLR